MNTNPLFLILVFPVPQKTEDFKKKKLTRDAAILRGHDLAAEQFLLSLLQQSGMGGPCHGQQPPASRPGNV
jgi:hypothetical protein